MFWLIGTDTSVGKTVVTAGLLKALIGLGINAQAVKAVQTGARPDSAGLLTTPDLAVYQSACPEAASACLLALARPCSPHLAAADEGRAINISRLDSQLGALLEQADLTLVEGAGGLFTPLNERETLADWLTLRPAPVILAAANRLGALNHIQLTLEALKARGLPVVGLILSETRAGTGDELSEIIKADNLKTVARPAGRAVVVGLTFQAEIHHPEPLRRAAAWAEIAHILTPAAQRLAAESHSADDSEARLEFDRRHLWHPYASMLKPTPVWEAERTGGPYIYLKNGPRLVDGMASWWSAIHGYNHPRILAALREQAARMPHVMFGGLTHAPAVELGRVLLRLLPPSLKHIFWADSGSVAVETALKMAVQYQAAAGRPKKNKFLAPLGGYHGDTLGAMSLSDPLNGLHADFKGFVPRQFFAERPRCRWGHPYDPGALDSIGELLARKADRVAGVIIEPIVQGAGGMWFYHPEYLKGLRDLCRHHQVLLITDEIAVGFGRTGKMFAGQWAEIEPDLMCLGKALTGGTMTLAAVAATSEVALGLSRGGKPLMHGPTFMANPLACAAARASLELLTESDWAAEVARLEKKLIEGLACCRELPGVSEVRILGGIGVLEMEQPVNVPRLQDYFVREWKVWLRPFNRLIYIMPPYVVPNEDLERLTGAMRAAVELRIWA